MMPSAMEQQFVELTKKLVETFPFFMHTFMHDFPFHESELPLNKTQQKTLHIINYHNTVSMGKLCKHLNMEKGSVTSVIDALVDMDLIRRERDRSDRRRINIHMTEHGAEFVRRFEIRMGAHIQSKIDTLSEHDRNRFFRAIDDLQEITRKLAYENKRHNTGN